MAKRKAEQRTAATPDRVESGRSIGADMARRLNERLWAEARWRRQQRFLLEEQARIARRYASPAPASAPASPPAPATPPDAELVKQADVTGGTSRAKARAVKLLQKPHYAKAIHWMRRQGYTPGGGRVKYERICDVIGVQHVNTVRETIGELLKSHGKAGMSLNAFGVEVADELSHILPADSAGRTGA